MDPRLVSALAPLVEAFEALEIEYQVGGSLASSVHGVPRSSVDVDILAALPASKVSALVKRIDAAYYVPTSRAKDAAERGASFNVIHLGTMLKVDIFVASTHAFRRSSLERRKRETLGAGAEFFVTSAEDIVVHKLDWYRRGGRVSTQQWQDVIGVLRVGRDNLDMAYMRRWAAELDLAELLESAWTEAVGESS